MAAVTDLFDAVANAARSCPHCSIEMETVTGKTYVYLRTVSERSRRYGFQKFIIVVPSVAIREGVLKNIEITAEPQSVDSTEKGHASHQRGRQRPLRQGPLRQGPLRKETLRNLGRVLRHSRFGG